MSEDYLCVNDNVTFAVASPVSTFLTLTARAAASMQAFIAPGHAPPRLAPTMCPVSEMERRSDPLPWSGPALAATASR